MRLKYYLRGIGIGITFATLLLTISFYFGRDSLVKEKLTNEEIIEKATALGMVMPEGTEAEDKELDTQNISEEEVPASGEADSSVEDGDVSEENLDGEDTITLDDAIKEAEAEQKDANEDSTVTYIPFSVKSGESSEMVSRNLQKAGLIDSADKFNKYLNELKVDNLVKSGTFYIQTDSSYDDIVALLVNKEVRKTTPPKAEDAPQAPQKPKTPKAGE